MRPSTAIILAAGRGIRMGPPTEILPKGLIEVGGQPMVRRSVEALVAAGITRVRIVTGHLADRYAAEFEAGPAAVELVFNPDHATTGSLRSLAVGLAGLDEPVLLLESDILYDPRGLGPLLAGGSGMVLSGPTHATDEVYTWACTRFGRDDQLLAMSKDPAHRPEPPLGEMTGMQGLAAADVARMRDVTARLLAADPGSDYEPGLVALAAETRFDCHLIPDLVWAEVDDPPMLARARDVVWPRLSAAAGHSG